MAPITRRVAIVAAAAAVSGCVSTRQEADTRLAAIEERAGGRLGAFILDTRTRRALSHRPHERFAMCSTFKTALAALILMEADAGRFTLDQRIHFGAADVLSYAPVARQNLTAGFMTIGQMAEGTQKTSDNTCANLLLTLIGGPAGFTSRIRTLGDEETRLDRYEPEMNNVPPGEVRDTTTPAGHARLIQTLLLGRALSETARAQLIQWMIDTETGLRRIRAGLPQGWMAGDKTGTGYRETIGNKTNDIAITWPPGRAPVIVTAYLETPFYDGIRDEDQALLAEVGAVAAAWALTL